MNLTNITVDGLNEQRTRAAAGWQDGDARYHFWFDLKTRTIEGLHFSDGKPTIYKNSIVTESREPGYFQTRYIDATKKKNVAIIAAVWDEINAKELVGKAIIAQDAADLVRKQESDAAALEHRKHEAGPELAAALQVIVNELFEDAVNGHLRDSQVITRDGLGRLYEVARLALAKVSG